MTKEDYFREQLRQKFYSFYLDELDKTVAQALDGLREQGRLTSKRFEGKRIKKACGNRRIDNKKGKNNENIF